MLFIALNCLFPSSSLAPTHYGNDYSQYAIQVRNAFVQQWPCIKPDAGFTPNNLQTRVEGQPDRLTAQGLLTGFEFQAPSLWLAQKRLYRRLTYEDNPYPGDSIFTHFLLNNQNATVGQYAGLQQALQNLYSLPDADWEALDNAETGVSENLDHLADVERQLTIFGIAGQDSLELETGRAALHTQLEQFNAGLETLRSAIQDNRGNAAQNLTDENAGLPVTASYEANEKAVNAIYLQTLAQGVLTFTEQQEADLRAIAALCPLAEGETVLQARALLAAADGGYAEYDDSTACVGILPREQRLDSQAKCRFLVYPNPVNQELHIRYNIDLNQAADFFLCNTLGQLVRHLRLLGPQGIIALSLTEIPSGIYYYFTPGEPTGAGKIIIQH